MGFVKRIKSMFAGKVDLEQRFELLRAAISGTMSSFYMARDRETDQVVGLKVLDPVKMAIVEDRFKALNKPSEGEILGRVKHPYVVKLIEHGVAAGGLHYIVMEFLDGPGLNSLTIGRSPLLDGNRVPLIKQAAEAIGAVHKAGFIHRDVCPRNFVTSKDATSLKLIDFGLTVPNTPDFTQPGNRTGTPNYMSPEVVRRRKTSIQLDVFSFGVTAYEVCTFELPWKRGNTGLDAMSHDSPPVDIRRYRPDINEDLAEAIMDCLKATPEARPPSMDDFLHRIRRVEHEDKSKA